MKFRRRLLASCVVGAVAIVACISSERLSSTQFTLVTLNGSSFDFGIVEIGTTSGSQTIVMSPASGSGDSDDTVTSVTLSNCTDFTVSVPPLPFDVFRHCSGSGSGTNVMTKPHWTETGYEVQGTVEAVTSLCDTQVIQNMNVPATFHPTINTVETCTVVFNGTFGSKTVSLKGTGVAPPFQISVRPSAIDFKDVKVGTTSLLTVDVVNIGSQDLSIADIGIDNTTQYDLVGAIKTAHVIPIGARDTFDVACHPQGIQGSAIPGTVTIHSNATNVNGGTVVIPLLCRGIDTNLTKNPAQVAMEIRTGESKAFSLDVRNDGNQDSTIDAIQLSAAGFSVTVIDTSTGQPPQAFTLSVGQTRTFELTYTAGAPESGAGTLEIDHDNNKVDFIGLTFDAKEAEFGTNESSVIDFGSLCEGDTDSRAVQVFSLKPGGFSVTGISTPTAPFQWTGAAGTVSGSGEEPLMFTAAVTVGSAGPQSSMVTLSTDIPGDPTHEFTLDVVGLPAGTNSDPPQTDYGTVSMQDEEIRLNHVLIRNCGTGDLTITGARIEGANAEDFQILEPASFAQPFVIPRRDKLDLSVAMAPKVGVPGFRTATLVVEHADGDTTTAELDGTATGDAISGPETYYECNSGGSGGLFVGLTVVGLLVRRRRRL